MRLLSHTAKQPCCVSIIEIEQLCTEHLTNDNHTLKSHNTEIFFWFIGG